MTSAREIWNSLEEKYTAEKQGADKFITFKFFEFAMENNVKKLIHTSEDFTLDHIQKYLRIEEETFIREKNLNGASSSKVNYVDSGKNNKENDKKRKVEQVDTTEITAMVSEMNIRIIQELHMASVTPTDDWWYDSYATTHVCNNRDLFKTYKETEDGHEVMMSDNHTLKVIGSGHVEIQFTFGKKLTLMNVLHVPNIRKNLVSGFKLCKSGVKAVIESDKVILSKANVVVGKAYTYVYLLKSKDQAFETFKIYKAKVENQRGWIHQRTTSYTPQQNGVAERKNRVLQDMSNAMLVNANLPKNLWGKSLLIACHRNRAESSSAHRRSEMARKERNLDLDFIDFQAIIFLVEGDNQNNVINKIPVTLPKGKRV
ncbi:zinc finger, CCHC-type containing protein [Tanacetum coccineum]